jgi:hypothetical protein
MKKKIFIGLVAALLLLLSVYFFIPNIISLKSEQGINVTQAGLHRMLLDTNSIKKWWPGSTGSGEKFSYNGYDYKFSNNNISLLPITISNAQKNINTSLYLVSVKNDSVQLAWIGAVASSYNPIKRISAWLNAKSLNRDMNMLIKKMQTFYSNYENIYGIKVQKSFVTDSILITTGANKTGYPDTKFIYSLVDILKKHAVGAGVKVTGYPMLNVETTDSLQFNVRVALPIEKTISETASIKRKRMLGQGNILVTEVTGDVAKASEALRQINLYANDYGRVPPAIPFFSLITDRRTESDSTKWITKIYCPVM